MTRFSLITIARLLTVAALGATPAGGAWAATITATVTASASRPLTLSARQSLNFGTILVPTITLPQTVIVSTSGARTCPAPLVCSGVARQAIYNVQGTNRQIVLISATASDLVNASNGSRIRFTPIAPLTVILTNSGQPGLDFNVGGSISIPTAATDGLYTGDIEVTVNF